MGLIRRHRLQTKPGPVHVFSGGPLEIWLHLDEDFHRDAKFTIFEDSWLKAQPLCVSAPAKLFQGGQASEQHFCLAAAKPKVAVVGVYRPSVLQNLYDRVAVDFVKVFPDRKSGVFLRPKRRALAVGAIPALHARVFFAALVQRSNPRL